MDPVAAASELGDCVAPAVPSAATALVFAAWATWAAAWGSPLCAEACALAVAAATAVSWLEEAELEASVVLGAIAAAESFAAVSPAVLLVASAGFRPAFFGERNCVPLATVVFASAPGWFFGATPRAKSRYLSAVVPRSVPAFAAGVPLAEVGAEASDAAVAWDAVSAGVVVEASEVEASFPVVGVWSTVLPPAVFVESSLGGDASVVEGSGLAEDPWESADGLERRDRTRDALVVARAVLGESVCAGSLGRSSAAALAAAVA
jgi:hypothetical protein